MKIFKNDLELNNFSVTFIMEITKQNLFRVKRNKKKKQTLTFNDENGTRTHGCREH